MPEPVHLGPIGRRVLVAFLVVALSSVAVLVVATAVGIDLGRSEQVRVERQHMVDDLAELAGLAYQQAGAWSGPGLADLQARAGAASAHLIVVSADDTVAFGGPVGRGFRAKAFTAPVSASGAPVGTAYLAFQDNASSSVADLSDAWLMVATAVAMVVALIMALVLTRRLTRPLVALTTTARAFAAGDREARAATDAPGELGELARTFNELADEVVQSDTARRLLSADIAHELRTPLTALQGGLEEIVVGDRAPDPATLAALHGQAVRLGRVVGDLADLSQAEAGGLRSEPQLVELADLVRSGQALWEAVVRGAGQRLEVQLQDGVWVLADPDRLNQVVGNLVANAARHGGDGGTVTIAVRSMGGTAVLSVADDGPGMLAEDISHAFDRFHRGRDAQRRPGSGLGLPIARALVEANGGRIDLVAERGVGTRVTIRFDLAE